MIGSGIGYTSSLGCKPITLKHLARLQVGHDGAPLGCVSRQIGDSANPMLVIAVTHQNESKKTASGLGQLGHHAGRTNAAG
jgi:hypothetical protein